MDFNDTPDEAVFRTQVRAFLDASAERRKPGVALGYRAGQDAPGALDKAKAVQAKKAAAGLAGITWPKEWGGRGGTPIQQVIYAQEEADYVTLSGFFTIGLGMCLPAICTWGTEEQRQRYAPPALRADEVWCQLFSEPAGGSDLAALRTRATPDGDGGWIINGQKIWTSGAHYCDFGLLAARTDFDAPKHKGLTFFIVPMRSPGVEIKPIRQMSGASHFNEVFFHDLRLSDSQRVGPVGAGWKVAITTLMNERLVAGESAGPDADELLELVRSLELEDGPAIDNDAVQERLAEFFVRSRGLRFTKFRTLTALSRGQTPGPEASINKLVTASKSQDIAAYALDLMGMAGVETGADMPMRGLFEETLLSAPGLRIAGGTDEILRNIIAERVLGLPGDVRVDKDVAFRDVPSGPR